MWDKFISADALRVTYDRWTREPRSQKDATDVLFEGQQWNGSYFCTQGPTMLTLEVTKMQQVDDSIIVTASLTFWVDMKDKEVKGQYDVAGHYSREGRVLVLQPVPGSWKTKPNNFVMVGLQGVISPWGSARQLRFAGSVPIFGCDSFELNSEAPDRIPKHTARSIKSNSWNTALSSLAKAIDHARQNWREQLQQLIQEKSTAKKDTSAQVARLMEAARQVGVRANGGVFSFEVTSADGEEVLVQVGR